MDILRILGPSFCKRLHSSPPPFPLLFYRNALLQSDFGDRFTKADLEGFCEILDPEKGLFHFNVRHGGDLGCGQALLAAAPQALQCV